MIIQVIQSLRMQSAQLLKKDKFLLIVVEVRSEGNANIYYEIQKRKICDPGRACFK